MRFDQYDQDQFVRDADEVQRRLAAKAERRIEIAEQIGGVIALVVCAAFLVVALLIFGLTLKVLLGVL